jgi:hypothetical protein
MRYKCSGEDDDGQTDSDEAGDYGSDTDANDSDDDSDD